MGDEHNCTVSLPIVCHSRRVTLETFPKLPASVIKSTIAFNTLLDNADRRASICSKFWIPRKLPFCTPRPHLLFSLYRRTIGHDEVTMINGFEGRDILRSSIDSIYIESCPKDSTGVIGIFLRNPLYHSLLIVWAA